jgi:undecaprenyl-diphosphatase
VRRKRINWRLVRWAAVLTAVVLFFVFRHDLPGINLDKLIEDLSQGLGAWTYLLVGALAFLETGAFVGLVAPGEFTVMLGGAVASQGGVSLPLIIAVTWLSAFAGDSLSFMLGARLGRGFLVRHGPRFRISEQRLEQVDGYFQRHGGKTILIGRFIGLVRALAPFIAGSSRLPYRAFAPFSILGTGLWATGLILIGYFAAESLDTVTNAVGKGLFVFAIVVGVVAAIVLTYRSLREPANRRKVVGEMERRRWLRPVLRVYRRLRPQLAFLGRRLTPGGLGLELTTLLAGLAVGLFVLIAYWTVVAADPGPTAGDQAGWNVAHDIETHWLTQVEKGVTWLGSGWVTYPLAALAGVVLALRRRWMEFWALTIGTVLIAILVPAIKEWVARPRPPDPLISVHGFAFPSGHATQATLYTWLAITLVLRVVPGTARRSLVIAAGILLTVVIGLSRVYLRVHWLSDVSAGWALGLSSYALAAAVVLVVAHIRHNPRRHERPRQLDPGAGTGVGH